MSLAITKRKVATLVADPRNARKHPESQVSKLVASIKEFGFLNPVVVSGDQIVAGHARVEAAARLGISDIPCVPADHLNAMQRKAFAIADNRIPLDAEWDEDIVYETIRKLDVRGFDIETTGFDLEEVEKFAPVEYNYTPNLTPETSQSQVTNEDISEATERLDSRMTERSGLDLVMVVCPHCGSEFGIRKDAL